MRTRRFQSSSDPVPSATTHRSVLLHEAVDFLSIAPKDVVVDATLGGAGHAREIAARLGLRGTLVGFDLDPEAIRRAREALSGAEPVVHLVEANFRAIEPELKALGITHIDKALFDLGWSAHQLEAGRGFSFSREEPLLMTYGKEGSLTAATIVNEWEESSIADILHGWGEERYARRIARRIVEKRPFTSAAQLAEVVREAVPPGYRHGRLHPATKTFQALRIAVNDELGALSEGLAGAWRALKPGGRIAVIDFHSVEDRVVKSLFLALEKEGAGRRLTKKPVVPGKEELAENPRARSAKLRVIERIHTFV